MVIRGGAKRNPGGKIYNRISNRKQKAAKRKRIEEKHQTETQKQAGKQPVDDPTVKEAEYWLEHNSQPWETTLNKWKDSFPARKPLLMKSNAVEEVLKRFRHYSNEFGFQLVSIIYFYCGSSTKMLSVFKNFPFCCCYYLSIILLEVR